MSLSWSLRASTRLIVALGAIACAHSTSRLISPAQPTWSGSLLLNGVSPCGAMIRSLGLARSKSLENAARSAPIVGLWNASMMVIDRPAPVSPPGTL